jgi:MFS family permease
LSIISNVFDPRERGKAIGVWAGSVGLGVAIGPIVGGALLEHFWWGSVFLINVPIVVIGVIAILWIVPESRDPNRARLDLLGVVLSIVGLIGLVYGIIAGGDHGFGDIRSWGSIVGGVAVLPRLSHRAGIHSRPGRTAVPGSAVRPQPPRSVWSLRGHGHAVLHRVLPAAGHGCSPLRAAAVHAVRWRTRVRPAGAAMVSPVRARGCAVGLGLVRFRCSG